MKTITILWIDNEKDLLTDAAQKAIKHPRQSELQRRQADLQLKRVKDDLGIEEIIAEIADRKKRQLRLPDLVVIDQKLEVHSERGITQRGSNVAVMLRTQAPLVPLVGVTGANFRDFPSLQKEQFIELFSRESILGFDHIPDLYAIADGFALVKKHLSKSKSSSLKEDTIIRLLETPSEDEDLLRACIPGMFKQVWDAETPHSYARWIWHTLLGQPGFTYDDLEIATLLGLTLEGFNEVAIRFTDCTFSGIFNSLSRRRWWVSSVRTRARELVGATISRPLWEIGRELIGNQHSAMFSRCYGHDDDKCIPDVVAYQDERYNPLKRVQALARDTKLIEADTPPMGFEQRRVFYKE